MTQKNIPIFLASNDRYSPFVATNIASISYNTKSNIDFYILDSGITNFRKKQICELKKKFSHISIEFVKIDFNNFSNFKTNGHFTLDIYSRILIPEIKPDLDRAIYLDVDTISLGNINELYQQNLGDYILGAVPEYYTFDEKNAIKERCGIDKEHKYFNSGVLLIDCEKWRKNKITQKILSLENELHDKIQFPDQDLLNKYFENNYRDLDIKYNLLNGQISFKSDNPIEIQKNVDAAILDTQIKHFEGLDKPWINNESFGLKTIYFHEFWFFAKMTNFYDGLLSDFIVHNLKQNASEKQVPIRKETIKFLKIIPLIKIKRKLNKSKIYLFNFIPLLTIKSK